MNDPTHRSLALGRGFVASSLFAEPFYLAPRPSGRGAPGAMPLAGGPLGFVEIAIRAPDGTRAELSLADLRRRASEAPQAAARVESQLAGLAAPREPFAGLAPGRPHLMGIVNATPDSFIDRGAHAAPNAAIAHARGLVKDGATIIDLGGESTRPGSRPVPVEEELRRLAPVLPALTALGVTLSIDSRKAAVMAAALDAGAALVNDISALTHDPASLALVAERGASVILMHMSGEPATMNQSPAYGNVVLEVYDWLAARVEACIAAGVPRTRIAVDPGFGFGKSPDHNAALLDSLALFHGLGCWLAVGPSGKRFGGAPDRRRSADERRAESLDAALRAAAAGAQILRVHNVAGTARALAAAGWPRDSR